MHTMDNWLVLRLQHLPSLIVFVNHFLAATSLGAEQQLAVLGFAPGAPPHRDVERHDEQIGNKEMQITFSYASGRRVAAVVLAVGGDFIRVASPRSAGGFNIYLLDQDWITETGKTVRVEALRLGDGAGFSSEISPKRARSTRMRTVAVAASSGW
jgi:hypothetical protein